MTLERLVTRVAAQVVSKRTLAAEIHRAEVALEGLPAPVYLQVTIKCALLLEAHHAKVALEGSAI